MKIDLNQIILADCMDIMREIPDKYFNVIYIDPPYYKIKGEFDYEMDFCQWQELQKNTAILSHRILKDNGSLIVWGHAKNIAYQQVIYDQYFTLLNSCVWEKTNGQANKMSDELLRTFAPITERFLFYDKGEDKSGPDLFKSIKNYMRAERGKVMDKLNFQSIEQFNIYIRSLTGTSSVVDRHYFADSQYVFPTKDIYAKLQTTGFFQREYEDLRREYEDLRRYFNLKTRLRFDVMRWPQDSHITKSIAHDTQKPYALTCEIIQTISREGDTILIPFSGSGTEAVACHILKRNFLAIEKDPDYHAASVKRLEEVRAQGVLF